MPIAICLSRGEGKCIAALPVEGSIGGHITTIMTGGSVCNISCGSAGDGTVSLLSLGAGSYANNRGKLSLSVIKMEASCIWKGREKNDVACIREHLRVSIG